MWFILSGLQTLEKRVPENCATGSQSALSTQQASSCSFTGWLSLAGRTVEISKYRTDDGNSATCENNVRQISFQQQKTEGSDESEVAAEKAGHTARLMSCPNTNLFMKPALLVGFGARQRSQGYTGLLRSQSMQRR